MDQSGHTDEEGGSMHSLESLLKMTWGQPFEGGLLDRPKKSRGFSLERETGLVHLGLYMYHFASMVSCNSG